MQLSYRIEDHICILSIEGGFAQTRADEITNYVKDIIKKESIKGFIVNLEKAELLDISSTGVIAWIFVTLLQHQAVPPYRSFALCHLDEEKQEIFKIANVDSFIDIYPTEEDALTAFRGIIFSDE